MGKSQYKRLHSVADPKEQVKITSGWKMMSNITTTPNPLYNPAKYDTTQEFYQTKGKKFRQPAQIGKRRETELEAPQWTDKVFTGDNIAATAYLSQQVRERNEVFGMDSRKRGPSSLQKSSTVTHKSKKFNEDGTKAGASRRSGLNSSSLRHREDLNADAEKETQLVHMKNTVTSEGEVDLAKVQDIIRSLRRRYSARSNVQHIFKDWDASGRGYLLPEDIKSMLDKMGHQINKEEAKMMLIALDENGDQKLSLNEFLDLVFTHNDALSNIDLSKTKTL